MFFKNGIKTGNVTLTLNINKHTIAQTDHPKKRQDAAFSIRQFNPLQMNIRETDNNMKKTSLLSNIDLFLPH